MIFTVHFNRVNLPVSNPNPNPPSQSVQETLEATERPEAPNASGAKSTPSKKYMMFKALSLKKFGKETKVHQADPESQSQVDDSGSIEKNASRGTEEDSNTRNNDSVYKNSTDKSKKPQFMSGMYSSFKKSMGSFRFFNAPEVKVEVESK